MNDSYPPSCYYWNCLNPVRRAKSFCSRMCMEDFVEIPPPWIPQEEWKGDYSTFEVETKKTKTLCHWCGKPTFKFHKGKERLPKCTKCKTKLKSVYYKAKLDSKNRVRKCKACKSFTNVFFRGQQRPPYCSSCIKKGIIH